MAESDQTTCWVLVSREVAEALMPRECELNPRCERNQPCPACDGSGTLPPVLTWLVVKGDVCPCIPDSAPAEWCAGCPGVHAPADLVRAIEDGERIGIVAACEMCGGDGRYSWTGIGADGYDRCPHCDGSGLVRVGSVRPVKVLPIVHWSDNDEESPSCISVGHSDGRAFAVIGFSHNEVDLSVYGDPESLIGRYAVVCEDARSSTAGLTGPTPPPPTVREQTAEAHEVAR